MEQGRIIPTDATYERPAGSTSRAPSAPVSPSEVIGAGVALSRLTVTASWRATNLAVGSMVSVARRAGEVASAGATPAEVVEVAIEESLDGVRRVLGVVELEEALRRVLAERGPQVAEPPELAVTLRERGAALLHRSAQLLTDEGPHPAFTAIVAELSPDEARILRLLADDGPQESLDVIEVGLSRRAARALIRRVTMVAERAGCRRPADVGLHLDNLTRLGLVLEVDEALEAGDYQLLEAQPAALDAKERAGGQARVRTRARTLALTALGQAFCAAVLPDGEPEGSGARPT